MLFPFRFFIDYLFSSVFSSSLSLSFVVLIGCHVFFSLAIKHIDPTSYEFSRRRQRKKMFYYKIFLLFTGIIFIISLLFLGFMMYYYDYCIIKKKSSLLLLKCKSFFFVVLLLQHTVVAVVVYIVNNIVCTTVFLHLLVQVESIILSVNRVRTNIVGCNFKSLSPCLTSNHALKS